MKVLQFMVEPHLQASLKFPLYERDTVLYTGTHDNNTLLGWYRSGGKEQRTPAEATAEENRAPENAEAAATPDAQGAEICRYFISWPCI